MSLLAPRTSRDVPLIVRLQKGAVACLACGLSVFDPPRSEVETLTSLGRMPAPGGPSLAAMAVPVRIEFARCPACRDVHRQARGLLRTHPRVAASLGSEYHALHKVECALNALDLLGASAATVRTDADLLLLIQHLTAPGALARWAARFVPFARHDAAVESCTTARWADASEAVRAMAREGLAAVLRARVEKPVPVLCPIEGQGCGFCGVDAYPALPSRAEEAWSLRSARAASLGGRTTPGDIDVWLCASCDRAAGAAGSVGPTAMRRALVAFLDPSGHTARSLALGDLEGLRGWAVTGLPPAPSAWAHLGDLSALRRDLGLGQSSGGRSVTSPSGMSSKRPSRSSNTSRWASFESR